MKVIFKAYIRNVLNKIKNQRVSVIFSGVMSLGSKHYIGKLPCKLSCLHFLSDFNEIYIKGLFK